MRLTRARDVINRVLAPVDLAVVRRSVLQAVDEEIGRHHAPMELPPGATEVLRPDHPRLRELTERYRGHPAAPATVWSAKNVRYFVDLRHFRGETAFVYQRGRGTHPAQYVITTEYVAGHDRLGLLSRLDEDDRFGAYLFDVDGRTVSRDLLDSVLELNVLNELVGLAGKGSPRVLDVGAGYGRLAHRFGTAFPGGSYVCTDAVALSTFLSEYYLGFRDVPNARVVPLDEVADAVAGAPFDVVVNIHSFPECPLAAIEWWLDVIGSTGARHLFVAADEEELLSTEESGARLPFLPTIERHGFRLVTRRPKYVDSPTVQRYGTFPDFHYLFERPAAPQHGR